ncbi:MAG: hypothetical protein ACUZ8H_09530 [Candidatus Anammoxibacter sp.]
MAPVLGFPFKDALLTSIGLGSQIFGDNKQGDLEDLLFKLAKEGVDVNKLVAPQLGAINTTFAEGLTQRLKGIFSQGLGNTGAVEEVPLAFMESKNQATGQAFNRANARNENIKAGALNALSGLDLGSGNKAFGSLTGLGIDNLLKRLLG